MGSSMALGGLGGLASNHDTTLYTQQQPTIKLVFYNNNKYSSLTVGKALTVSNNDSSQNN